MTPIPELTAASRRALEQFDLAKASGSPSAISAAKVELVIIKTKLELAKAEAISAAAMSKALHAPARLTR